MKKERSKTPRKSDPKVSLFSICDEQSALNAILNKLFVTNFGNRLNDKLYNLQKALSEHRIYFHTQRKKIFDTHGKVLKESHEIIAENICKYVAGNEREHKKPDELKPHILRLFQNIPEGIKIIEKNEAALNDINELGSKEVSVKCDIELPIRLTFDQLESAEFALTSNDRMILDPFIEVYDKKEKDKK